MGFRIFKFLNVRCLEFLGNEYVIDSEYVFIRMLDEIRDLCLEICVNVKF